MKKKLLIAGGLVLSIFILSNICWFGWRSIKYDKYTENMEENTFTTVITPRYAYKDGEGYDYLVKYPDYLSFTGNLSVGMPVVDDDPFTDALLVWPQLDGNYEYGLLIYEEDSGYQIYIDAQGNALDDTYNEVIERHKDDIDMLLEKADDMWGIKK